MNLTRIPLTCPNGHPLPQGRGGTYAGFTLIELLVVVLIIGILAAVALPQYQKAVEKSRVIEAFIILKSVYQSMERYRLETGVCPTKFDELDIQIPWSGNTKWNTYHDVKDTRSADKWSVQLISSDSVCGVSIGRIAGPYAGTGFAMYLSHTYADSLIPQKQIVCLEQDSHGNFLWEDKGAYCEKIFSGDLRYGGYSYLYSLPH